MCVFTLRHSIFVCEWSVTLRNVFDVFERFFSIFGGTIHSRRLVKNVGWRAEPITWVGESG